MGNCLSICGFETSDPLSEGPIAEARMKTVPAVAAGTPMDRPSVSLTIPFEMCNGAVELEWARSVCEGHGEPGGVLAESAYAPA